MDMSKVSSDYLNPFKHLDCYLKEFIYRFNRRWNEDKLFYYLTRWAIEAKPLSYHRLIAEPIG